MSCFILTDACDVNAGLVLPWRSPFGAGDLVIVVASEKRDQMIEKKGSESVAKFIVLTAFKRFIYFVAVPTKKSC